MKPTARQVASLALEAARRFLVWWRAELEELGEEVLQVVWPRMATAIRLDLRAEPARMFRVTRSDSSIVWESADPGVLKAMLAGTLPPPKELGPPVRKLEVLLPESAALIRTVQLPLAASARLRTVLELQYKRLMPLKRELVLLDHRILNTSPASGQMTVALATLRRAMADPIAAMARAWGFRSVAVVVPAEASGTSFRFEATTHLAFQAPDRLERGVQASFAALMGALLLIMLFGWKAHDLMVERQIANLIEPASAAAAIENELKARQEIVQALELSLAEPGFVQILSELTKATPSDAWVFELSRRGYELRLAGEASQSSLLALRLNESPLFSDVRLGGTTVASSTSYGRFEISLDLDEPAP